ncbi:MAG: cytochrome P460 family protein [Kofleriaceae bacterium]|jgi:hypothetical protein|nr:cytochrome P460 family protein [Kofleriaceae bacterium]MBP6835729.1 cytochrome P460 family protein [Kofleriaceae bacterium]
MRTRRWHLVTAACLGAALAACTEAPIAGEPLGDYRSWLRVDASGDAPGHGDTYRVIYANDLLAGSGPLNLGAVAVKEVYERDGDQPGALRYVAIMRKQHEGVRQVDDGGWLFTTVAGLPVDGGEETPSSACWDRCHRQAPLAGTWIDYARIPRM